MLDVALKFLTAELNVHLLARAGASADFGTVEVSRIVDDAGKWAIKEDHVGAAIINIEEERHLKAHLPESRLTNGRHVQLSPVLKLNLHVLFAASFKQYAQALAYLSHVLTFFQSHLTFTQDTYPALDPRIERLNVELQSLSYEQLNQVWAFVGGKQLPSVIYKVRMVILQDEAPLGVGAPIQRMGVDVHGV